MKIKDSVEETYQEWQEMELKPWQEAMLAYLHDIAYGIALLVEDRLDK